MCEPGGQRRSCVGDLSVDGAAFTSATPPVGDVVELSFCVPTYEGPIVVMGQVIKRSGLKGGTSVSVVFVDLDVDAQLAIAEWLQPLASSYSVHPASAPSAAA